MIRVTVKFNPLQRGIGPELLVNKIAVYEDVRGVFLRDAGWVVIDLANKNVYLRSDEIYEMIEAEVED